MSEISAPAARRRQAAIFQGRFAEWLEARAALQRLENAEEFPAYEEQWAALSDHLLDAARLVMTTPAPYGWIVWRKFEILEQVLCDGGDVDWADRRHLWMLAGIKADLLALGDRVDEVDEA